MLRCENASIKLLLHRFLSKLCNFGMGRNIFPIIVRIINVVIHSFQGFQLGSHIAKFISMMIRNRFRKIWLLLLLYSTKEIFAVELSEFDENG